MRLEGLRRRVRTATSGRRGSAQLGLVLAAAAAAGGMTLGSGVADQHARSGYDLAWLADGTRGQLVQVDPVLGRANVRLQVADPGSSLTIQQGDGHLVVIDRKTGKITSIDLGTLLVGGTRSASPGDGVKVLLAGPRLYVADLPRGTVQAVDPATQADIGTPWKAGRSLVDIGVDGAHDVWALDSRRTLTNLRWNGTALAPVSTRSVEGAGPGSVIVGHDRGITLVGSQGAVVRVGTGNDSRLDAPHVQGPLHAPGSSPNGIVPVSDPGTSSVVIVGPHDAVVDDVSGYGCTRPAAPTVFDDKVYVPCTGAHKVIVLDASGKQVGSAIPTPTGGEPQLTVSGGHLVIDVPGSGKATIVDPSGDTRDFPTVAPGIGVQNPNTPPPDPPAPPKPEPSKKRHNNNNGDNPNSGGRGDSPTPPRGSGTPSSGPSGSSAPVNPTTGGSAEATARPDGSVLVTWDPTGGAGATVVTDATSGDEVATVPAGATSATVTVLTPGTTTSFVVRNATLRATTNSVTTSTRPGSVTGLAVTSQGLKGSTATISLTWAAAAANGSTVSYAVNAGGSATKTTSALNTSMDVPCASSGCSGTVTVTPRNSAGAGTAASTSYTVSGGSAPAPAPAPGTPAPADPATQAPAPQPTTQEPAPQPTTQAPPPQIAMPGAGEDLVSTTSTAGNDNSGTPGVIHVTITAPSDWATFGAQGGTCALYADGVNEGQVACGGGDQRDYEYTDPGTTTHTFWVVASDSGRSVESAHKSQTVRYTQICSNSAGARSLTGGGILTRPICTDPGAPTCPNCQIPFAQLPLGPSIAAIVGDGVGIGRVR